jgi:2-polyprenyl-3-methyl-5-hydroxy-6-metoxy-1,4-benzoquinol methylase
MSSKRQNLIINGHAVNLKQLKHWQEKPAPFTPGEPLFWDDPHISAQMLATHLDPTTDLASRRPETIERSVAWIVKTLGLFPGARLLDLGCGPGLYATRFAQLGINVTGIDYSQRSIEYAIQNAREHMLDICYRYENYLELTDTQNYDAALLIFGDFCPLAPEQRSRLLRNVYRALKPGGHFVFDVSTREHRKRHGSINGWNIVESGFWKPGPHLILEQGFDYPEQSIYLNQAIVVEANGELSVYRMWFQDYARETITQELEAGGFAVESVWSDLLGTDYEEGTEWIGVVAQAASPTRS